MLNRIHLLGHLARDPEIRAEGDKPFAILDVSTNETFYDRASGARASRKVNHTVVIRREATVKAVPAHLKSGSRVMVDGTLRYEEIAGDDGVVRPNAMIIVEGAAHRVTFLDDTRAD